MGHRLLKAKGTSLDVQGRRSIRTVPALKLISRRWALSKAVPRDGRAARFRGRTLSACKSFVASATQGVALGYPAMHLRCEKLPCSFGAKTNAVARQLASLPPAF